VEILVNHQEFLPPRHRSALSSKTTIKSVGMQQTIHSISTNNNTTQLAMQKSILAFVLILVIGFAFVVKADAEKRLDETHEFQLTEESDIIDEDTTEHNNQQQVDEPKTESVSSYQRTCTKSSKPRTSFGDFVHNILHRSRNDIFFNGPSRFDLPRQTYSNKKYLATDITKDGEEIIIAIDVPGVDRKDIDVIVDSQQRTLTVKTKRAEPFDYNNPTTELWHRERFIGEAERTFQLSQPVSTDKILVELNNGVLYIRYKPEEPQKPVKIF
jgi:HSP20 family protein